ncbi:hypothetical protein O1L60_13905 [Streptomyces diastatochromogenes]|nr:hypothetical protein [Streptomyces diastatochromogenes]
MLMARLGPGELAALDETHERYRPGARAGEASREACEQMYLSSRDASASAEVEARPRIAWVSMERALQEAREALPEALRKAEELLPPRGEFTVVSNYGTGGDPEARGRRDHDMPSATITGKVSRNRVVHKGTDEDLAGDLGRFSNAEAGVLQTFRPCIPGRARTWRSRSATRSRRCSPCTCCGTSSNPTWTAKRPRSV